MQLQQAAGALRVDVDDIVLQPGVHRGLHAAEHGGGEGVVVVIGEWGHGR